MRLCTLRKLTAKQRYQSILECHIGESLTGGGGQVLRQLGLEAEMYRRQYPCKQGVQVFGQSKTGSWFVPVNNVATYPSGKRRT